VALHGEVNQSKYTPGSFISLHFTDKNIRNVRTKVFYVPKLASLQGEFSRSIQCLNDAVFALEFAAPHLFFFLLFPGAIPMSKISL
jgi:hypothetical protein